MDRSNFSTTFFVATYWISEIEMKASSLIGKERDIQKAILELLAACRVYAIRINSGAGWGKVKGGGFRPVRMHSGGAGVADIIAFPVCFQAYLPSVLWIEVKTPDGRQSPEQLSFEQHVKSIGMYYLVARSAEDVAVWLRFHR